MDAFSTPHLDMSDAGMVWLHCMPDAYLFDAIACGHVAAPFWPRDLGHEPDWFDGEIWQCLRWWEAEQEMSRGEFAASLAADRRALARLIYT